MRLLVFTIWLAILVLFQAVSVIGGADYILLFAGVFMALLALIAWTIEKPSWATMWAFLSTMVTVWIYI